MTARIIVMVVRIVSLAHLWKNLLFARYSSYLGSRISVETVKGHGNDAAVQVEEFHPFRANCLASRRRRPTPRRGG